MKSASESLNAGAALVDVMQLTGHRNEPTAFGYFQPKGAMTSRVPELLELKMKRSSRGVQKLTRRVLYAEGRADASSAGGDYPRYFIRRGQFMTPFTG